jgi:hypothetical protein
VEEYFEAGRAYPVGEFVERSATGAEVIVEGSALPFMGVDRGLCRVEWGLRFPFSRWFVPNVGGGLVKAGCRH